jgi:hypothetical protein
MRKLLPLVAVCLALAVPAALAQSEERSLRAPVGAVILQAGLADPLAVHEARRKLTIAKRRARPTPKPVAVPAHLQAIAQCESGGDPGAIGGGGLYRGKYQFSVETWQAVGGKGDPARAPEAEQDRRAIILYNQSGPGQWPVCGS